MHNLPMSRPLALAALFVLASAGWCQTATGIVLRDHAAFEWKTSGTLPPGAEYQLLYEEPKTHAVQLMARFKAGYKLPTHRHTNDESIVVVKGKLAIELDGKEEVLGPGSYAHIPARTPHTLRSAGLGRCEFLVIMTGPFDVLGLDDARPE